MAQHNIDAVNDQLMSMIENLNTDMKPEELKNELAKAKAVATIAGVMFEGKRIQLEAAQLLHKGDNYKEELKGLLPGENK